MKIVKKMAFLVPAVFSLAGCQTGWYEPEFGNSVRESMQAQVINPDAGNQNHPPIGISGVAAKAAVDKYNQSFSSPLGGSSAPSQGPVSPPTPVSTPY
jgi:hypothetical protein